MIEVSETTIKARTSKGVLITQFNCRYVPEQGDILIINSTDNIMLTYYKVTSRTFYLDKDITAPSCSTFNNITIIVTQVSYPHGS